MSRGLFSLKGLAQTMRISTNNMSGIHDGQQGWSPAASRRCDDWGKRRPAASRQCDDWGKRRPAASRQCDDWGKRRPAASRQHDDWGKRRPAASRQHERVPRFRSGGTPLPPVNTDTPALLTVIDATLIISADSHCLS